MTDSSAFVGHAPAISTTEPPPPSCTQLGCHLKAIHDHEDGKGLVLANPDPDGVGHAPQLEPAHLVDVPIAITPPLGSEPLTPPPATDGKADPDLLAITAEQLADCHLVHTEGSAELWVGNKTAALNFAGEKLCVLEDPHCRKASDTHHIAILEGLHARRARLDEAADYISARLAAGAKLLVHCSAGMERSPLTVAWWLVRTERCKSLTDGYFRLQAIRPIVQDRRYWVERLAVDGPLSEREKYEHMWAHQQYRQVSPGESCAALFCEIARPRKGSTCIDFGAGTGRGGLMLAILGLKVEMLDFADNCLDEDVRKALDTQAEVLKFRQHDLTERAPIVAPYGFCTDVMEHIPPDQVDLVLANILRAAEHVFFQISCTDDSCGVLIGHPLHLTVKPYAWWLEKFRALDCQVHWSKDCGTHCLFYLSAWQGGRAVVAAGELNVAREHLLENVRQNLEANWTEVQPHETNDFEVMLLGGGPSLAQFEQTIIEQRKAGMRLITMNGAYNWALERGLTPSAQIVVDSREMNAKFTKPVVDGCRYLIASQAHPSVLEGLPRDRTFMWHSDMEGVRELVNAKRDTWWPVHGGSTVFLRSIPLMRMLGYRLFHVYGVDSCWIEDKHHAYEQDWNTDVALPINCGGRIFRCATWHFAQAQEFMDLIRVYGEVVQLAIYGDGLLAHILKTGAQLADEGQFKLA